MICIVLPFLPPTANHAYFNRPRGGRVLTEKGKKFKTDVRAYILKHHSHETQNITLNVPLGTFLAFGVPDMMNSGWPKRAEMRFKKMDLSNRLKLLEDALSESMNMDDSQIFFSTHYKYESEKPETRIWLWNEEREPIGVRLIAAFSSTVGVPAAM